MLKYLIFSFQVSSLQFSFKTNSYFQGVVLYLRSLISVKPPLRCTTFHVHHKSSSSNNLLSLRLYDEIFVV